MCLHLHKCEISQSICLHGLHQGPLRVPAQIKGECWYCFVRDQWISVMIPLWLNFITLSSNHIQFKLRVHLLGSWTLIFTLTEGSSFQTVQLLDLVDKLLAQILDLGFLVPYDCFESLKVLLCKLHSIKSWRAKRPHRLAARLLLYVLRMLHLWRLRNCKKKNYNLYFQISNI